MMAYERTQVSTLLSRLNEKPLHLNIVTGPRQTGKTTVVRQALGKLDRPFRYVSVDEPEPTVLPPVPDSRGFSLEFGDRPWTLPGEPADVRWLVRHWEQARMAAQGSDRGFVLAIDGIQKIPNWSETVKGLWDADRRYDRPIHVVLICSVPFRMQRGMRESLAGRFVTIRLMHWSFTEMSAAFGFDFQHHVYFGGCPGSAPFIKEPGRWRRYITDALIDPGIVEDILAMQRVDKPALLHRLFQLSAEYSGQVLSYNRMLGQLQDAGNTTTLARYLGLLSSAGLITGLPKYTAGVYPRRSSSPRLNVLNTALMTIASGYTFEEAKADRSHWGRLVKSAVGAHLFNTGVPEHHLHYWCEKDSEVDFVLTRGRRLVAAFKVQSGASKTRTSGLERFAECFDVQAAVVVGEGGLPISEFLSTPASKWLDGRGPG